MWRPTTWARSSGGGAGWPKPSAPSCGPPAPRRASRRPSTSLTDRLLEIGQITKPHGLKGEVFVKLSTNRGERLEPGAVLQSDRGPMRVDAASAHQNGWIVRFDTISTREDAEAARGLVLRAEPLDLPDELWVHELIDAKVVDVAGTALGRCVAVEANPASDLIVLDGGGLIPLRFVVAHEPGRVTVDPPAGLLEL